MGFFFYVGDACKCTAMKLREELTRALLEAKDDKVDNNEQGIESFNQLVQEMTLKQQDVKAFAFKTKAMVNSHSLSLRFIFIFSFIAISQRLVLFLFPSSLLVCTGRDDGDATIPIV